MSPGDGETRHGPQQRASRRAAWSQPGAKTSASARRRPPAARHRPAARVGVAPRESNGRLAALGPAPPTRSARDRPMDPPTLRAPNEPERRRAVGIASGRSARAIQSRMRTHSSLGATRGGCGRRRRQRAWTKFDGAPASVASPEDKRKGKSNYGLLLALWHHIQIYY